MRCWAAPVTWVYHLANSWAPWRVFALAASGGDVHRAASSVELLGVASPELVVDPPLLEVALLEEVEDEALVGVAMLVDVVSGSSPPPVQPASVTAPAASSPRVRLPMRPSPSLAATDPPGRLIAAVQVSEAAA